jgi:threonylcarbamoyladenosine tRNA methylthiotransferase MtaB
LNCAILNFGCKVNQYQGELLRETLASIGAQITEPDAADIVFVNGCLVTDAAEKEALRTARRWSRGAKVVATGCAGVAGSFGVFEQIDPTDLSRLSQILSQPVKPQGSITAFSGHTRAMLLVQLGCDNFCSYCIVPSLRGKPRSRPEQDIISEARNLAKSGHSELVLCGTELGHYENLAGLIARISEIPELMRIRLSSINPRHLTPDLVKCILAIPKVAPHLHLPLQSGSDGILSRMKRGYDSRHFASLAETARSVDRTCGITTDIIVGFPGEDDGDFQKTIDLMEAVQFDRCHIFPFSPRKGTEASAMQMVPKETVNARMKVAKHEALHLANRRRNAMIKCCTEVLVEDDSEGFSGNYHRVRVSPFQPQGAFVRCIVKDSEKDCLIGDVVCD